MASAPGSSTATSPAHHTPSNSDIMSVLKCLEVKLDKVESRLQKLDLVEKKVLSFEKDLKLLTVQVHDSNKGFDQRMTDIDERVNRFEFISAEYQSRIDELERENLNLKDKVTYLESQSMRNNLVFGGFPEESGENLEDKFRKFLVKDLKLAQNIVDSMKLERIHRMGVPSSDGSQRKRNFVVKFTFFSDRELVRRQKHLLKETGFLLHEQFPPEIAARRRKLMPQLKEAIKDNKRAWLVYDTLYIEGKPVKCN
ncbi:uncharacterized protein LOC128557270 [Mercenaria mercenaria]|uniref:uncharacterized protein LOC128557270 n=1 Tax=Mercenaria mercenaria TaxID=6596 RepID=UPI00234F273B|nr:uncharacterized protein LOC128557270 [Mercenaria mercenaria]